MKNNNEKKNGCAILWRADFFRAIFLSFSIDVLCSVAIVVIAIFVKLLLLVDVTYMPDCCPIEMKHTDRCIYFPKWNENKNYYIVFIDDNMTFDTMKSN